MTAYALTLHILVGDGSELCELRLFTLRHKPHQRTTVFDAKYGSHRLRKIFLATLQNLAYVSCASTLLIV